jgi:hypothetical protein
MLFRNHREVGDDEKILQFTGHGRFIVDGYRMRQPSAVQHDNYQIALGKFRWRQINL